MSLGTIMLFTMWVLIWPNQQKILGMKPATDEEKNKARRTAVVIGIRTDESLRRFLAVASDTKPRFENLCWTTEIDTDVYNAYPIYDWRVEDVWGATARLDLEYNRVYDLMQKAGVPLSRQRICQPFGSAQKAGLDQFRAIEPVTWERMLERVEALTSGPSSAAQPSSATSHQ